MTPLNIRKRLLFNALVKSCVKKKHIRRNAYFRRLITVIGSGGGS